MMPIANNINPLNYVNIIQWNVRSLPSLQNLLSYHKCSIALLSETWLLPSRSLSIPNFKIYRSDQSLVVWECRDVVDIRG